MARRGENIRRRKDGRWEGRYYAPEPGHGGSVLRSVYAGSYGEVKEKLSALREASDRMSAASPAGREQSEQKPEQGWEPGQKSERGWEPGRKSERGCQPGQKSERGWQPEQRLERGRQQGQRLEQGRQQGQSLEQGRQQGQRLEQGQEPGQKSGRGWQPEQRSEQGREPEQKPERGQEPTQEWGQEQKQEPEIFFEKAAEEWLALAESTKKYATYMKYRTVYERHLREKLGGLRFAELDADVLAGIFQGNGRGRQSESLQKSISCVLNQILSYAALHYHTGLPGYARRRQKMAAKPVQILNSAEQARLLQSLHEGMDIYKLGIIVCLSTGLRLGEICSLKWGDIDMEGKMLHVNTTVQRIAVDGQDARTALLEGEPKSIFSKRQIPISEELVKLLAPFRGSAGEYVISGRKPMEPRTYQNKFQKYLELSGVSKKNFHILRHTFATNCIGSGTDIKSLSEILGHSDVKITLNRYVHPSAETKRQHMDSLFSIYGQLWSQR